MSTAAARPHVAVARLDNTGDVLLTGPAVRAVARTARHVTFICGPAGREAARMLPGVDDVVELAAPWVPFDAPPLDPVDVHRFVATIMLRGIDEALVLTSSHQSPLPLALLLRLAGVRTIAGTSTDYPGSLLDERLRDADVHEVERSLRVAAALGHELADDDDRRLALRGTLPSVMPVTRPYVVVHPGASVPARSIGGARAAAIVNDLVDTGWAVAVTGGAREQALTAAVSAAHGDDAVDLGGRLDLMQLAGVLAGASAVVCGNTGPAHLAAAVGTPVVALWAPVVPAERWRPWGVPSVLLGDSHIGCAGCRARTCPVAGQPCLLPVTPAAVVEAVHQLAGAPARRRAVVAGSAT